MKDKSGWQISCGTTSNVSVTRMLVHDPEVSIEAPVDASNAGLYIAESARDGVQGWSVSRRNIDQFNGNLQLLDENLRQGALARSATGMPNTREIPFSFP